MFVEPDARPIPPRWEPPRRAGRSKRGEDVRTALIALVFVLALFGPEIAGTAFLMLRTLAGLR